MNITKDTQFCISIAEHPGNFGNIVFNATFKALSLNYIYKSFKVREPKLAGVVEGIRALGIRGCGVSMPHKLNILKFLDHIDSKAQEIGAVNTVVNNNGVLSGYNTDYEGAKQILKEKYDVTGKKVLIVGAGGVSRAIIVALKKNNAGEIYISNRNEEKGRDVARQFNIFYYPFVQLDEFDGHMFINATPVGMLGNEDRILRKESLENYECIMDVVITPKDTFLISESKTHNKIIISGYELSIYQALHQFKLYTGIEVPKEIIEGSIQNFLNNK